MLGRGEIPVILFLYPSPNCGVCLSDAEKTQRSVFEVTPGESVDRGGFHLCHFTGSDGGGFGDGEVCHRRLAERG